MQKHSKFMTLLAGVFAIALMISTSGLAQSPDPLAYIIKSRVSGKVLDVPGFSFSDHAQIQQIADNGGVNQEWRLEPVSGGYFKIISRWSGKALDIPDGSFNDNVVIQQFTEHNGLNQQWELVQLPGGYTKIVSRLTRKVLDVPDGNTANGVKIQQYTLDELPIDYSFKYATRYDRCTTCHLGLEKTTYTKAALRELANDPHSNSQLMANLENARKTIEDRNNAIAEYNRQAPRADRKDPLPLSVSHLQPQRVHGLVQVAPHARLH